MKALLSIFALTLLASGAAEASWYQEFCSDAEAVTRTASGHNENFTEVTERTWGNEGPVDKRVREEAGEWRMELVSEKEISRKEERHCPDNGDYGWASFSEIKVKNVKITKEDGSLFSKNTIGVSEDLKSVEAVLLCRMDVSGEMPCNSK